MPSRGPGRSCRRTSPALTPRRKMPPSRSSSPPRAGIRSSRTRRVSSSSSRTRTASPRASSATSTAGRRRRRATTCRSARRRASRARRGRISKARRTRTRGSSTCFFYDKEAVPDPLNQRTVQAFAGPRSEVRMPFFVAQPEVDELGSAPKGELIAETFESRSLGGKRRVWFYLPPGYAAAKDTLFPVVYVLDGSNYVEKMDAPKVLDHLIANKIDSAGDRGVLGAGRSAGGVFAQPEVARLHRQRAGAGGRQALPHLPDTRPSSHSRQLACRLWRDRSRRRRAVGVRAVRGHRAAGPDRHGRLEPGRRRARPWCRSSSS